MVLRGKWLPDIRYLVYRSQLEDVGDTICHHATYRSQSRALVDGVVSLLAVVRLAVAADASHTVHAALVGAARAGMEVDVLGSFVRLEESFC